MNAIPHVRSGKLRALAVTSAARSPAVPDVPSLAEATRTDYESVVGYFLLAPAATPQPIIDRLNAEAVEALKSPDLVTRYERDGAQPLPRTSAATAAYIATEIDRLGRVIRAAGIRAD